MRDSVASRPDAQAPAVDDDASSTTTTTREEGQGDEPRNA
jgi:hypothetical protein